MPRAPFVLHQKEKNSAPFPTRQERTDAVVDFVNDGNDDVTSKNSPSLDI